MPEEALREGGRGVSVAVAAAVHTAVHSGAGPAGTVLAAQEAIRMAEGSLKGYSARQAMACRRLVAASAAIVGPPPRDWSKV